MDSSRVVAELEEDLAAPESMVSGNSSINFTLAKDSQPLALVTFGARNLSVVRELSCALWDV